jgi:hypothetical protein
MSWIKKVVHFLFGESVAEEQISSKVRPLVSARGELLDGTLLADLKLSESADFLKELLGTLAGNDAHLTRGNSWESHAMYE